MWREKWEKILYIDIYPTKNWFLDYVYNSKFNKKLNNTFIRKEEWRGLGKMAEE